MEYVEVQIEGFEAAASESLVAALLGIDYDSFSEEDNHFRAYIPASAYNEERLKEILSSLFPDQQVRFTVCKLEDKDWNAEWERNYQPVLIAGKCMIRAPFHPAVAGVQYDILIEPKMSFGTAHHETTSLMIEWMLDEPVTEKHVLDMGCGTGVLAILAAKMGAKEVRAIDNDPWAFVNATENCLRNKLPQIHVIQGDEGAIPSGPFDIILANINRNILLAQMPVYSRVSRAGAALYVSGFYEEDLEMIRNKAEEVGFAFSASRTRNKWMAVKFVK